jgi:hypothetical protein
MKKLFVLLVLLLCFSLRAAPVTNVYLQWTDTNNFKPAIVQVIQTNPLVTITIPAVTAMVYKVYFSTNLLLPVKNWPLWSSVAVINPHAKHAQHGHTDAEFRGLLYGHGLGSVCGARKRFFYSGGSEGDPIASANGYRPLDAARTIRRVLRSPKDAFKYQ